MVDIFVAKVNKEEKAATPAEHQPVEKTEELDSSLVTLFSTFTENPSNISFHHREEDEKIILFLRSHLITNFKWIFILFTSMVILPPIFLFGANYLPFPELPGRFTSILVLIYYLILFAYAFSNFLTWYFNIFVITKKRVIDIDYDVLVFHDVAETQFTLLQDVNYTQSGPIMHFFNYGDVHAQTAGGKENLEALSVPNPSRVTKFIAQHMGRKNGNV